VSALQARIWIAAFVLYCLLGRKAGPHRKQRLGVTKSRFRGEAKPLDASDLLKLGSQCGEGVEHYAATRLHVQAAKWKQSSEVANPTETLE
jgi:hypothetical protein